LARSRDFKAEYARRLARAQERGISRQLARGHRPGEARRRAERERKEFGITGNEARTIRAWVDRLGNAAIDAEEVVERAQLQGYGWFQNYRDTLNEARRAYRAQRRGGSYVDGGEGYLSMLAEMADVEDVSWVYYH
jgi:hypothetical protein